MLPWKSKPSSATCRASRKSPCSVYREKFVITDATSGEEIKACVVLEPGRTSRDAPPEHIVEHCRRRLAIYKVPRYIEYREAALPRTASGKIRKQVLGKESSAPGTTWDRTTGNWT